ncbi:MAG TPA: bifunctional hydroxymethylpyrimidine kinase/phosphomethylpyrimidine kinase [Candidatus Binatia bacterium]|nr:bifunctional hydroxymethylpyrimidine kinase/phosphomethylpyrimidine kinase [Candidatus Binatia bacterium]
MRPVALTIAGSDPSGGAGLQADLAVFAVFGVHGTSVATALTVQDTRAVRAVAPVAADVVRAQLDAVLGDFDVRAAKTGMLHRAEVVTAVAERLSVAALVVDPVAAASDGTALLDEDGIDAVRRLLVPLATVITPNLREAELLVERPVRDPEEMRAAARALVELGARAALVKGGHLAGDAVDVFYDGHEFRELTAPRTSGGAVHGTGCALSAAIAAQLAAGRDLPDAIAEAKRFVTRAIAGAMAIGGGARLLDLRR